MDTCKFMCETMEQSIVYVSFPQISDLSCAICEIDFVEVRDSSAKSNFHWQTMKCRILIYLISDIIASPVSGTERYIFVVGHRKLFETGKLQKILRNFKLVYQGLRAVTNELYKSCLIYTIQTKIAPLWCKVDDYFVQGKEFYKSVDGIRALKLDILINEGNISLQLHVEKVKIPCIKLEDYLPPSTICHFLADPKGYIDLTKYKLPFIHVLPSTKKGKLLSVSKELPENCIFKDYDQLRKHWKNMYGYSLPKNKDGVLYYEIKFLIPKSNIFIYPNMCLTSGPLNIIPNRDKKLTITQFLSDILIKLPTICGKPLQISEHTPFNTKFLGTNFSSNILPKDKDIDVSFMEKNNTTSQLEFSAGYANELHKMKNISATSLETQLAKIHQIHNIPFHENLRVNSSRSTREFQDGIQCLNTVQNVRGDYVKNSTNDNFTVSNEGSISNYFKIQKPHPLVNEKLVKQDEKQKNLTLKDKLEKATCTKNNKESVKKMDQSITVETMAKNNQLDQLRICDLSEWLQQHSVPHNSKGKKTELISKVLSHIRNTQMLHQFRI